MRYYRSCLQRQLYANGRSKTILSKATQSSGSVEALVEEFPDARFITIFRHPDQSVPSHVSVFYPVWRAHSPEIAKDSDVSRAYARLATAWYRHLFEMRERVPPGQFHAMDYRELVRSPKQAVEQVYVHFGWTPSPAYREALAQAGDREEGYKSAHRYTLEEFGLSKAWIREQIGDVLDAYGLEV